MTRIILAVAATLAAALCLLPAGHPQDSGTRFHRYALLAASPEPASPEPWNDAEVQAWLLRLTNHSGATAGVRDAALVLHDWIKP